MSKGLSAFDSLFIGWLCIWTIVAVFIAADMVRDDIDEIADVCVVAAPEGGER